MTWLIVKYLISAGAIVLISEVAKRSGKIGALLTALPLISLLALIWMYAENQPVEKIGNYAFYTFWYVIPTLPLFLIFPYFLPRIGFWGSLGISAGISIGCFLIFAFVLRRFGIDLI